MPLILPIILLAAAGIGVSGYLLGQKTSYLVPVAAIGGTLFVTYKLGLLHAK